MYLSEDVCACPVGSGQDKKQEEQRRRDLAHEESLVMEVTELDRAGMDACSAVGDLETFLRGN
jgi:hypothetical protein